MMTNAELCHRCGKNPAVKDAETKETVKTDEKYVQYGTGTQHTWKETTYRVARCLNCKRADDLRDGIGIVFGLIGIVLVGMATYFWLFPVFPWSRSLFVSAFVVCLIFGAVYVMAYGGFKLGRLIARGFVSYG
jgi:hypothetical protein